MSDSKPPDLSIAASDVPTFGCVVYVKKIDGGVTARMGNLESMESTGASERDAISKLVPAFKEMAKKLVAKNEPVPWIDPPLPMQEGEQKRFIPVHL